MDFYSTIEQTAARGRILIANIIRATVPQACETCYVMVS